MMGESAPIQRWVQLAGYALIVGAAPMVLSPFLVPLAWAAGWAAAVATAAGNVGRNALDAVLALFTLFFLYRDGPVLVPQIQRALHGLGGERFAVMFQPLGETIRAVMYGTLFTALSQ